jgi:hypothetical protein
VKEFVSAFWLMAIMFGAMTMIAKPLQAEVNTGVATLTMELTSWER